jgi:hypothetical protein
MEYEKQDIENFIRSFLDGIKKGVGDDHYISDDIEFNLAVVKTKVASGGFKIFVADAQGKYASEKISTVKFKVRPESEGPSLMGV